MGFKVYNRPCKNCLLTEERIVSPERKDEIIDEITKKQSYFVCHKASMNDGEVCCKKFYDDLGHVSQMVRIAERLNMVEFVEQPDNEKLIPWKEMEKSKKKKS